MPANDVVTLPAAEFQALPLDFVVAAPLLAAVRAQAVAAEATRAFLESMIDPKTHTPVTVDLSSEYDDGAVTKKVQVKAPLLALVPVPHLRIDALDIHFSYEVTQAIHTKNQSDRSLSIGGGTSGLLAKWVNISVNGSVSSSATREATTNRSGTLEITVHASESPVPEGLARVLSLLAHAVPQPEPAGK